MHLGLNLLEKSFYIREYLYVIQFGGRTENKNFGKRLILQLLIDCNLIDNSQSLCCIYLFDKVSLCTSIIWNPDLALRSLMLNVIDGLFFLFHGMYTKRI